jgi:hypothetical protein
MFELLPNIRDNQPNKYGDCQKLVIFINIWQKLSSLEREMMLIVTIFWQLFSHIFGETQLIVTHIWRNPIHIIIIRILILFPRDSIESL